jgi:hypothetical protein
VCVCVCVCVCLCVILGIEHRALHMQGKCPSIELFPQPHSLAIVTPFDFVSPLEGTKAWSKSAFLGAL